MHLLESGMDLSSFFDSIPGVCLLVLCHSVSLLIKLVHSQDVGGDDTFQASSV